MLLQQGGLDSVSRSAKISDTTTRYRSSALGSDRLRHTPRVHGRSAPLCSLGATLEKDFRVQENAVRKWFHAPWLHWGNNEREFVRGLTRERTSRRYELATTQDQSPRNYAVGFYNPRGGYVIRRVWQDPCNPKTANVAFPEGSVAIKLLFTTAPVSQVPYLDGAPEWVADIHRSQDPQDIAQTRVRLATRPRSSRQSFSVYGLGIWNLSI